MADPVVRALVVGGIVAAALLAAYLIPRVTAGRAVQIPIDLSGIDDRVILFTSSDCSTCDRAREVIEAAGVEYREIRHSDDPALFDATGVAAVPLLVIRGDRGAIIGRIGGVPTTQRLRRALSGT
ncbi:hypothetical protein HQ535_11920 [bacterium]|nr:hypothetical protein [bacterium]